MFIFSNLATSLDGKIAAASREFHLLGTEEDRRQMQVLRKRCDAILFGATTLRAFQRPCIIKDSPDFQPLNVVVSRSCEGFDTQWKFFTSPKIKRLLFVSEMPSHSLKAELERTSDIQLLNPGDPAPQIVRYLETKGIKQLLVEGGGGVMWDFAKHDLIDEYNVTLTPRIVGGKTAPTLVDGEGFRPTEIVNLKLKECRQVGDELYLVYKKSGTRG